MISEKLEKELIGGTLNDPLMYETLLKENPTSIIKYYDCVEELQWAVQHWYHADVAVIEEAMNTRSGCVFTAVLENYTMKNGGPWIKTSRVQITPNELLGMYLYYQKVRA